MRKVLEAVAEQFDKLRGIYQSKNMETEVTFRNALRFLKNDYYLHQRNQ